MKLTIFAPTGGVGRHLLEQAVDAGHDVTAVARRPQALSRPVPTVTADLSAPDPLVLEAAVAGADAVLSGLGPRRKAEHGIVSTGTRAITEAMKSAGARRVVVVSVAGVMTIPTPGRPDPPKRDPGAGPLLRYVVNPLSNLVYGRHYADVALMEDILRRSGLVWTAVGVPVLTDKPATGVYRTAHGQSVRGGLRIARADAAQFMLRSVDRPDTFRQSVAIAY